VSTFELSERRKNLKKSIAAIQREVNGLQELEQRSKLTDKQSSDLNRKLALILQLTEEYAAVGEEWQGEMRAAIDSGAMTREPGDCRDTMGPTLLRGGPDPWEYASDYETRANGYYDRAMTAAERAGAEPERMTVVEEVAKLDKYGMHRDAAYVAEIANPAYLRAYEKWLVDPQNAHIDMTDAEREAMRRVRIEQRAVLDSGSSSVALPLNLDPSFIVTGAGSTNPILGLARTVQTVSNTWAGVTVGQVTAAVVSEYAATTESTPAFVGPSIPVYRSSVFVPASFEAAMDIPNFATELSSLLADSAANWEAALMVTGSGSSQPYGCSTQIGNTTASRVATTTAGQYGSPDIYKVANALPARHRPNASFVMENSTINTTRQFGTQISASFMGDLTAPPATYMLGKRLVESSSMASSVTTGKDLILYGDFAKFVVARRSGFAIEQIPNLMNSDAHPLGGRGFFCWWRFGCQWVDTDAARQLRVG
jgi:HK97 family phage major capsid protein